MVDAIGFARSLGLGGLGGLGLGGLGGLGEET